MMKCHRNGKIMFSSCLVYVVFLSLLSVALFLSFSDLGFTFLPKKIPNSRITNKNRLSLLLFSFFRFQENSVFIYLLVWGLNRMHVPKIRQIFVHSFSNRIRHRLSQNKLQRKNKREKRNLHNTGCVSFFLRKLNIFSLQSGNINFNVFITRFPITLTETTTLST